MNWQAVGGISEILGALAVIVTLVYLTIQIRQNSAVVRTSNYWQLTAQLGEFAQQLTSDPSLLEIYQRGLKSYQNLTEPERARFHMLLSNLFTKYQVMLQLQRRGQIDQTLYDEQMSGNKLLLDYPGIREWWTEEQRWFAGPFRNFINQSISDRAA